MVPRSKRGARGIVLAGALGIAAWGAALAQSTPESASYRLPQSTLDAAGSPSAATGSTSNASLGQPSTIGASSSPRFVLQSGFWSFAGSGLVPVVLYVRKNAAMPEHLDLEWTGNNPPYVVYRSASCPQVFSTVFASESTNQRTDPAPLPDHLSCYNVLATAPGPINDRPSAEGGGKAAGLRTGGEHGTPQKLEPRSVSRRETTVEAATRAPRGGYDAEPSPPAEGATP